MGLQGELDTLSQELKLPQEEVYDLIIIGSGPAGMSAALCAARAKKKTIIIDRNPPGGQTSTAYKISNYLGFSGGIVGPNLAEEMENHLKNYGCDIRYEMVEDIVDIKSTTKIVKTDLGNSFKGKKIIIAVGLEPKELDSDFERRFLGRGISYYAQSDVETYRNADVAVIGGGNCASYAADYLSQVVNKLYIIHRSNDLKAVSLLKEKIIKNEKIDILWNTELEDVFGIDKVEKIKLKNIITNQQTWLDVKGVFIYVGRVPPKTIISLDLDLDEKGFIVTDEYMRTNIPGVYAAGDIRSKQIRQIATAVSDGMIAAINADRDSDRV